MFLDMFYIKYNPKLSQTVYVTHYKDCFTFLDPSFGL